MVSSSKSGKFRKYSKFCLAKNTHKSKAPLQSEDEQGIRCSIGHHRFVCSRCDSGNKILKFFQNDHPLWPSDEEPCWPTQCLLERLSRYWETLREIDSRRAPLRSWKRSSPRGLKKRFTVQKFLRTCQTARHDGRIKRNENIYYFKVDLSNQKGENTCLGSSCRAGWTHRPPRWAQACSYFMDGALLNKMETRFPIRISNRLSPSSLLFTDHQFDSNTFQAALSFDAAIITRSMATLWTQEANQIHCSNLKEIRF